MPLRCIDQRGATIDASTCEDADWKALRARARAEHHLRMPCCTAAAVLKTSPRGTRFFAHKAKAGCTWKPETEVHRYLKSLALSAAREAGWAAETESSGTTPDGERWTADVLAWRGDEKTAVEIQWSSQTNEETLERQERYQRSGVRGVWLLRQPGFPVSEDLPAACIGGSFEEGLKVLVPKVEKVSRRHQKEDQDHVQVVTPEAFMTGVFEGRFRFGIRQATNASIRITAKLNPCENGTKYIANLCKWERPVIPATLEEAKFTVRVGPHRIDTTHPMAGELSGLDEQIRKRISPPDGYVGQGRNRRRKVIWCNECARTVDGTSSREIDRVFNYDLYDNGARMSGEWIGMKEMLDELELWAVWEANDGT